MNFNLYFDEDEVISSDSLSEEPMNVEDANAVLFNESDSQKTQATSLSTEEVETVSHYTPDYNLLFGIILGFVLVSKLIKFVRKAFYLKTN